MVARFNQPSYRWLSQKAVAQIASVKACMDMTNMHRSFQSGLHERYRERNK